MKRRFAINILCIPFFVLVVLLGCSKGSESYYPLKEGMTWEYRYSSRSGGGLVTEQSETTKLLVTNFAPRELKGKEVTPQKMDIGGSIIFMFFTEDSNGIHRFAVQQSGAVEPEILPSSGYEIKYPIKVGTTWDTGIKFTIESIDDVVTVSAGTFKRCVKIKGIGASKKQVETGGVANIRIENYYWFAPGVGLIKKITKSTSDSRYVGSLEITSQLESFKK